MSRLSPRAVEAALVALLIGHNWAGNRMLPRWAYVPFGLAVGTGAAALSRYGGATPDMLGLDRRRLGSGVRSGLAASAIVAGCVTAGMALPAVRPLFADERVQRVHGRALAYEVAVRIPIGTAVAEELLFRSALLGLSLNRRSWGASIAWSSALFGLWHILPTITTVPDNAALTGLNARYGAAASIASSVAVTTIGGVAFAVLRQRAGSIVAPILLHATGNVAAFAAARRAAASDAVDESPVPGDHPSRPATTRPDS